MKHPKKESFSSVARFVAAAREAAVAAEILVRDKTVDLRRRRKWFRLCAEVAYLACQAKRLASNVPAQPRYNECERRFIKLHGYPPDMLFPSSLERDS